MLYLGDYFFKSPFLIKAANIPWIRREVRGYDAVHGGTDACFVLGLLKGFEEFTLIDDVHSLAQEDRAYIRGYSDVGRQLRFIERLIMDSVSFSRSDFFISCSGPIRDTLVARGIDMKRIDVIRNGVDTRLFRPKGFRRKNDRFVVCYAGAFQEWQGVENLVEAARLLSTDRSIAFKVIGFRREDQTLKCKLARILGARAELMDAVSQKELVDQLALSNVLVIPRSRNIATRMAFPTKFAEYLATGRPVIVTDVDETATYVRKHGCGFVCSPEPESIARAIMRAKEIPSEQLDEMGIRARSLAESNFDLRVIGRQYFEFLDRVLSC
jgi:glycosyltransferase involved in cell wall biosynthesis